MYIMLLTLASTLPFAQGAQYNQPALVCEAYSKPMAYFPTPLSDS